MASGQKKINYVNVLAGLEIMKWQSRLKHTKNRSKMGLKSTKSIFLDNQIN